MMLLELKDRNQYINISYDVVEAERFELKYINLISLLYFCILVLFIFYFLHFYIEFICDVVLFYPVDVA